MVSSHLRLFLICLATAALRAAPIIGTQPVDLTVTSGSPATFAVAAQGAGALTYQWQRNGFALPGATLSTYSIPAAARVDADYYSVVVNDASATPTTSAIVRLSVAPATAASSVAPDPAWELQLEFGSGPIIINASHALPDGGYFVAGSFTSVNGNRRCGVARINRDGSLNPTFVPPEMDSEVSFMGVQSDGKVLVAGRFTRVGAYPRAGFARLNPNGSLDTSFVSPFATNDVTAIAVQPDGKIVIGLSTPEVVRLNSDGSRDSTFRTTVDSSVRALAPLPDGRLLIAGSFKVVNSVTRNYLARLNADGSLDLAFNAGTAGAFPIAIVRQADGKILVGGRFSTFAGVAAGGIIRLTENGAVDPSFNSRGVVNNSPEITAIAVDTSQRILVGGQFNSFDGASRTNFVRLAPSGSLDSSFPAHNLTGAVNTISVAPLIIVGSVDAGILVGGSFTRVGTTTRTALARINSNDTLDGSIDFSFRRRGFATAVAALPGGKLLLGGLFGFVRGVAVPSGIVRMNADGTVDRTFNPGGAGAEGPVTAVATLPDGRIVIGGSFTAYNGSTRASIAMLTPTGALDPAFAPSAGVVGGGFFGIRSIGILPGNRLAFGGFFTVFSGAARNHLAVTRIDGTLDPSFVSPAPGLGGSVEALAVQRDGMLLVAGNFTTFNSTPVGHIARLRSDGSLDTGFTAANGSGFSDAVKSLDVRADGKIVVGGGFNTFNGSGKPGIARLNTDGSLDATFAHPGFSPVNAAISLPDGSVLARGFGTLSDPVQAYLARFSATGVRDLSFVSAGVEKGEGWPCALLVRDDGQIIASSSPSAHGLLVTRPVPPPAIATQPVSQSVAAGGTVTFGVTAAASAFPLTYQWSLNGRAIAGATQSTYTVAGARLADAGNYTVTLTSELGTVTSNAATLLGAIDSPRLTNVSTRGNHGAGDRALIAGFVISGTDPKPIVVRAIGPALAGFGVTGVLADPVLELFRGSQSLGTNDNWEQRTTVPPTTAEVATAMIAVGAFPLAAGARDAVVYQSLPPGAYSAVVRGNGTDAGIALVEVYDASDPLADSTLINLSTRSEVGRDSGLLIVGFVVRGARPKQMLVRAAGPALGAAGVAGALADPVLEIYRGSVVVAANDDWDSVSAEGANNTAAARQAGAFAFPAGSRDAAVVRFLDPGAYTVQVRGARDTTGVALVEIYEVP